MKIFRFLAVAFVAMLGLVACNNDCEHEFIEVDHSADLVGTWTCLEADHAAAYIFNADGTVATTGVDSEGFWEDVKGTYSVVNNKITMEFDSGHHIEGSFDIIPGQEFSFVDNSGCHTYQYCKEDLSDEIVGMWVWVDSNGKGSENMGIQTFNEDGTALFTGGYEEIDYKVNNEFTYKVVGDLLIQHVPNDNPPYMVRRLTYTTNGIAFGDIMTTYNPTTNYTASWLRIKQSLDLTGKTYDYSSAYVSNAKGKDEDFSMLGHTFNIANIKGHNFDMLFRSELFCVDLNANSITQRFRANGRDIEIEIPITVDGNKVTLDLSAENPAYRKVDMYMFQDQDNTQLHMYMHTNDFINYFANMELYNLLASGEITADNASAIEKVYTDMEARVESINVSFVFKARK